MRPLKQQKPSNLKAFTSAGLLSHLTWLPWPVAGFWGRGFCKVSRICLLSSSKFDAPAECIMCLLIQICSAVHALFPGACVKLYYPVRFQGQTVCAEQISKDGSTPTGTPLCTGKRKKLCPIPKFFSFFPLSSFSLPPLSYTNNRTHDSLVGLCCTVTVRQNYRAVKGVKTAFVYSPTVWYRTQPVPSARGRCTISTSMTQSFHSAGVWPSQCATLTPAGGLSLACLPPNPPSIRPLIRRDEGRLDSRIGSNM